MKVYTLLGILILLAACQAKSEKGVEEVFKETVVEDAAVVVPEPVEVNPVPAVKEIEVTAKQWMFTPNPVIVNKGDKVKLVVKSVDVKHGFRLKTPFIDINEELDPNKEVVIEFTAAESGEYDFWCSVYCGTGHGSMRGTLIVE